MILLDTNVVSEMLRQEPSAIVRAWLNVNFARSVLSSVSIFELGAGWATLPDGRRKDALKNAIGRLVRRFGPRVYPFDSAAAVAASEAIQDARRRGLALGQLQSHMADAQIAGIAKAYDLELATRNVRDFEGLGIPLIDPWSA